ncbi:MAG TPA: RcnB family protein [Rhodopila sp.]|jgi:Ni/Co efflux regulator RcnB|nr:RcnB family protein [Rhodopila sp.]
MIRALMVAAALSLVLPGVPMAQQRPDAGAQGKPGGKPATHENRPGNPGRPNSPNRPARPQPARPQPARPQPARPQPGRPTPPQAGRPGNRPNAAVSRPLPPRGNQFWHRGKYYGRIHGPAFAYPRGWQYRRWSIGGQLPAILAAPSFFYQGWAALGLQQPPPGYSWVRFGPDLLLVNLTTYEVEDVVYGVFE